jgi:flagellar hook-associated protein 2
MTSITFSGLASGLDTSSIISQLVAAEKVPEQQLQSEQSDLSAKKSIVDNLSTTVASLGNLFSSMTLSSDVQYRTASASDSHVTVAASGDAIATSHDVRVEQLARAQVTSSRTFTSNAAGVLGDGSVTIQTPSGTPSTVSWDATDSLSDVASKINDAKAGVTASVLFDGSSYRLIVNSNSTGTANAATFTDSGDGLDLSDSANVQVAAQDAKVKIDGIEVTRPTNIIDDALTGVTITAVSVQAATDPDTSLDVSVDHDAIKAQLGQVVNDYNGVINAINQQLTYTGTTAGTDTLFGDSTLQGLKSAMDSLATQQFGGMSMSDLGLTFDKTGVLSLDDTTLDATLDKNPDALNDLFVTGGMSTAFVNMSNAYTESGDGILTSKSQGFTDESTALQSQIDQIESNATALQSRLQDQFNALEATMSKLNSQASQVSSILGGSSSSSKSSSNSTSSG